MNVSISPDTQAILLLTAPLIVGRNSSSSELLTPGEYKRLARFLREKQQTPADLLQPEASELLEGCQLFINCERIKRLLSRGFQLSQALEHWQTRAIWVMSRADPDYPQRLKTRLKEDTPPVLYGCGDKAILDNKGLAVVGSRHVDDALLSYAINIGQLSARAHYNLVSGGARGIDQAAMRGALESGGKSIGILSDSLERMALNRENRNLLINEQLLLLSPYDPSAGFNTGQAMQRNKLIYAMADAALVVSSDYMKGGTWNGAVEQIDKFRLVPIYVRSYGEMSKGLDELRRKGALRWPDPKTPEDLVNVLSAGLSSSKSISIQSELAFSVSDNSTPYTTLQDSGAREELSSIGLGKSYPTAADELFTKVRHLLEKLKTPRTIAEVATDLQVSRSQAKEWLERLVKEGVMEKHNKPVRYSPKVQHSFLA